MERAVRHLMRRHREADAAGESGPIQAAREKQIATLKRATKKVKDWLSKNGDKLGATGRPRKSNLTDNESAKMKTSKGVLQGYDGVAMVDARRQVVVHAQAYGEALRTSSIIAGTQITRCSATPRADTSDCIDFVRDCFMVAPFFALASTCIPHVGKRSRHHYLSSENSGTLPIGVCYVKASTATGAVDFVAQYPCAGCASFGTQRSRTRSSRLGPARARAAPTPSPPGVRGLARLRRGDEGLLGPPEDARARSWPRAAPRQRDAEWLASACLRHHGRRSVSMKNGSPEGPPTV